MYEITRCNASRLHDSRTLATAMTLADARRKMRAAMLCVGEFVEVIDVERGDVIFTRGERSARRYARRA